MTMYMTIYHASRYGISDRLYTEIHQIAMWFHHTDGSEVQKSSFLCAGSLGKISINQIGPMKLHALMWHCCNAVFIHDK